MSIAVKRFLSYVIDMFIVFIFVFFISTILPNKYDNEISSLNQDLLESKIDNDTYFTNYKHLLHEHDKQDLILNISTTILLISFFVLVPYCFNGQTIGQKILKIKITKDKELTKEDLIGRSVVINGIGYMLFMFIILYITSDNLYFILINLLAFLQFLVVIISAFMVSYSYEHLSIADKFTNTRIEEIK
jgi:hypothetical protein